MGIKRLNHLLGGVFNNPQQRYYNAYEYAAHLPPSHRPIRLAVDVHLYIHKCVHSYKDPLWYLLEQYRRLVLAGFTPIYVFDGIPPKEKDRVIRERKEYIVAHPDNARNTHKLGSHVFLSIRTAFRGLGIPFVFAPFVEADTICAAMYLHNLVDACLTDDMDIVVFGCDTIIRTVGGIWHAVHIDDVLESLGLQDNRPLFITLCVLLGTDYNPPLHPQKKPEQVLKILKETGSFDAYTRATPSVLPSHIKLARRALDIFTNTTNTIENIEVIKCSPPWSINNLLEYFQTGIDSNVFPSCHLITKLSLRNLVHMTNGI